MTWKLHKIEEGLDKPGKPIVRVYLRPIRGRNPVKGLLKRALNEGRLYIEGADWYLPGDPEVYIRFPKAAFLHRFGSINDTAGNQVCEEFIKATEELNIRL